MGIGGPGLWAASPSAESVAAPRPRRTRVAQRQAQQWERTIEELAFAAGGDDPATLRDDDDPDAASAEDYDRQLGEEWFAAERYLRERNGN